MRPEGRKTGRPEDLKAGRPEGRRLPLKKMNPNLFRDNFIVPKSKKVKFNINFLKKQKKNQNTQPSNRMRPDGRKTVRPEDRKAIGCHLKKMKFVEEKK